MLEALNNLFTKVNNSEELLLGNKIQTDPVVAGLLNDLVDEVSSINSEIIGLRPPNPALAASSKATMDHLGKLRGRPLYHNYVGTGSGTGPFVELIDGNRIKMIIN